VGMGDQLREGSMNRNAWHYWRPVMWWVSRKGREEFEIRRWAVSFNGAFMLEMSPDGFWNPKV
jgi:hypothetical protein